MNPVVFAQGLAEARKLGRAIPSLTRSTPALSLTEAYSIQRAGKEIAFSDGERLCGYKMGLTSRAKQRDCGVSGAIHGYLLHGMEILKGLNVDAKSRIHPRIEPEIAVVLKSRLDGENITLRDALSSIGYIIPAVDILDSRYEGGAQSVTDMIADNGSASGFILGSTDLSSRTNELPLLGVSVRLNGELVATGAPVAVMGDPLVSLVELARALARERKALEAGMVVLTGAITAPVPFQAGDLVEVLWPGETIAFRAV